MTSWSRKELKKAKKEKKRCKKMYSDWRDDEFNCGPNKFIFGVVSDTNKYLKTPQDGCASFQTLNDLTIYYNRDMHKYVLDIDVYACCDELCDTYLTTLLNKFKDFVETLTESKINHLINDNIFTYLEDMSGYWTSDTIHTLYFKFYMFVIGYKQLIKIKNNLTKKLEVTTNND